MNLWTKALLLSTFLVSSFAQAEKIGFHVPEYVGYKKVYVNSDGTLTFIEPTVVFDGVARYLIYDESAEAFCNSVGPFSANSVENKTTSTSIIAYNHGYSRTQESSYYIGLVRCQKKDLRVENPGNLPAPPQNDGKFVSIDRPSKLIYAKSFANYNGITTYVEPRMFFDNSASFLSVSNAKLACSILGKDSLNAEYSKKTSTIYDPEYRSTYQGHYMAVLRCKDRNNVSTRKEDLRAPVSHTKKIENFGGVTTYISPKIKFDGAEQFLDSSQESGALFCESVGKRYVNGEDQHYADGVMTYDPDSITVQVSVDVMTLIRCK